MNKPILIAGLVVGGGALAFIAYRMMKQPSQSYSTTSANPQSNPNQNIGAPTYPFTAPVGPRVDNSNQPWANNNRPALNGVSSPNIDVNLTNVAMIADFLKSGSDIIDSGQSIWRNISSWFDDGDASSFMGDWTGDGGGFTDWSWA